MSTPDSGRLPEDLAFEVLSSSRRRAILYHLLDREGEAELRELAEHVASQENDVPVADLDSDDRKRVYVSLYQTHVPKLVETGLVTYDDDSGRVALTDRAEAVVPYLRTDDGDDGTYRYLLLAAVQVLLGLGAAVGLPVLGEFAGVLLVALGVALAALVLYDNRPSTDRPEDPVDAVE